LALEAFAEVQAEREAAQGDLFGDEPANLSQVVPIAADGTHRGRRPGVRNKRTDELARWFIAQNDGRHPLARTIEIAGLPILAKGVLEGLAERLQMSRADAAKFWAGMNLGSLPYVAQRQSAVEIRPSGAPGSGQPILWQVTEDGELLDATHDGSELRDITPTQTVHEDGRKDG
jgi:hypothetical protein